MASNEGMPAEGIGLHHPKRQQHALETGSTPHCSIGTAIHSNASSSVPALPTTSDRSPQFDTYTYPAAASPPALSPPLRPSDGHDIDTPQVDDATGPSSASEPTDSASEEDDDDVDEGSETGEASASCYSVVSDCSHSADSVDSIDFEAPEDVSSGDESAIPIDLLDSYDIEEDIDSVDVEEAFKIMDDPKELPPVSTSRASAFPDLLLPFFIPLGQEISLHADAQSYIQYDSQFSNANTQSTSISSLDTFLQPKRQQQQRHTASNRNPRNNTNTTPKFSSNRNNQNNATIPSPLSTTAIPATTTTTTTPRPHSFIASFLTPPPPLPAPPSTTNSRTSKYVQDRSLPLPTHTRARPPPHAGSVRPSGARHTRDPPIRRVAGEILPPSPVTRGGGGVAGGTASVRPELVFYAGERIPIEYVAHPTVPSEAEIFGEGEGEFASGLGDFSRFGGHDPLAWETYGVARLG